MTPAEFRSLALALPETVESSHMEHPDFRVAGKIFATLGMPDHAHGMVKLTPEGQAYALSTFPTSFKPASGAWGRSGCTHVLLSAIDASAMEPFLLQAWRKAAPKRLIKRSADLHRKEP